MKYLKALSANTNSRSQIYVERADRKAWLSKALGITSTKRKRSPNYFTNITTSSFTRLLTMFGFHKLSCPSILSKYSKFYEIATVQSLQPEAPVLKVLH